MAIAFRKTTAQTSDYLAGVCDYLLLYAKSYEHLKYRRLYRRKELGGAGTGEYQYIEDSFGFGRRLSPEEAADEEGSKQLGRIYSSDNLTSQRPPGDFPVEYRGREFRPGAGYWKTGPIQFPRLLRAGRVLPTGSILKYKRFLDDFAVMPVANVWDDTSSGASSADPKRYVVQTAARVVERCLLMVTDPGDLVLDPTCGAGTTAYVAEQWGRRWITIDTSRVALALARARVMGARYSYYMLSDSRDGQMKEAQLAGKAPSSHVVTGNVRQGFIYERVPHVTLKSIANNAEIDVIWEKWHATLEPLRAKLNGTLAQSWAEWEIPRDVDTKWADAAKKIHSEWWQARIARQKEIDASIAAKAEFEYLYDKPYDDKKKVRVAGPFTVESLSPHRVLSVDENDELIDRTGEKSDTFGGERGFAEMILENLRTAGVQQAHKEDKIAFTALKPWPGQWICADGRYREGNAETGKEKRAAIFIGPEFGTVSRPDLVAAAREAGDADFDVLIACAFSYDAHSSEFEKLGRIPVLKARMNADLHMADDLKNTGKGNLFVIFGEPEIEILPADDGQVRVKVKGVDVFDPSTGEVRSGGVDGIACWFIDTDYNEESFFVRHAYFLGASDPYSALKTTLKAEINEEAWATLREPDPSI